MKKLKNLNFRLSLTEIEQLTAISNKENLTLSELIRKFIRHGLETHEDFFLLDLANERVKRLKETTQSISVSDIWKIS